MEYFQGANHEVLFNKTIIGPSIYLQLPLPGNSYLPDPAAKIPQQVSEVH